MNKKIKNGPCRFYDNYNVNFLVNKIIEKYNDNGAPGSLADFIIKVIKHAKNNDINNMVIIQRDLITLKSMICDKKDGLQYYDIDNLFQKEININQ